MKCEFRIMSGGRAGYHEAFDKAYVGFGRHPLSDFRFDADQDLDVSARHAAVVRAGDRWVLRDLGSRNGTFVNGRRITARPRHTIVRGHVVVFDGVLVGEPGWGKPVRQAMPPAHPRNTDKTMAAIVEGAR